MQHADIVVNLFGIIAGCLTLLRINRLWLNKAYGV